MNLHVSQEDFEKAMKKHNRMYEEVGTYISKNNEIPIYDY